MNGVDAFFLGKFKYMVITVSCRFHLLHSLSFGSFSSFIYLLFTSLSTLKVGVKYPMKTAL